MALAAVAKESTDDWVASPFSATLGKGYASNENKKTVRIIELSFALLPIGVNVNGCLSLCELCDDPDKDNRLTHAKDYRLINII